MLSLQNLTKVFRSGQQSVTAVNGLSLEVEPGEFVAVSGPSGCGKSTLLMMAGGLLKPDSGSVILRGTNLYELETNQRAKFRSGLIGYVFQELHLVPYLSVLNNVKAPSLANGVPAQERALALIEEFGLTGRMNHRPGKLSVGERQRTALARAMLNEPSILLADEPTGNLDAENSSVVLNHMRKFVDSGGSVLLVTHDPVAAAAADRIVSVRDGAIEQKIEAQ